MTIRERINYSLALSVHATEIRISFPNQEMDDDPEVIAEEHRQQRRNVIVEQTEQETTFVFIPGTPESERPT